MAKQQQYTIDFSITCPKHHSELMLHDVSASECLIEELSAFALLTLFDTVWIKNVELSVAQQHEAFVTVALLAQGTQPLVKAHNMDMLIEDKLTCTLAELFDSVHVERCAVL
ncbi:MAG TPA: hypothetical protein VGD98_16300 [Ktedonobacteraceae bacterium]